MVGRVSAGHDVLRALNALKTDPVSDAPQQRVRVARCGFTDAGAPPLGCALWEGGRGVGRGDRIPGCHAQESHHKIRVGIFVSTTPAAGTLEDFDEAGAGAGAGGKKESAEEAAARVKLEAAKARESVR